MFEQLQVLVTRKALAVAKSRADKIRAKLADQVEIWRVQMHFILSVPSTSGPGTPNTTPWPMKRSGRLSSLANIPRYRTRLTERLRGTAKAGQLGTITVSLSRTNKGSVWDTYGQSLHEGYAFGVQRHRSYSNWKDRAYAMLQERIQRNITGAKI